MKELLQQESEKSINIELAKLNSENLFDWIYLQQVRYFLMYGVEIWVDFSKTYYLYNNGELFEIFYSVDAIIEGAKELLKAKGKI